MHYYDRQGREIDVLEWAHLYGDAVYRFLGRTVIANYYVSTVWDGGTRSHIDAIIGGWTKIPIFSTGIFRDGELMDEMPYFTEAQAIKGHYASLRKIHGALPLGAVRELARG